MKHKDLLTVKILCLALMPLLLFVPLSGIKRIKARCERVIDGDTVAVRYNNELLKIRLAFIDAPELAQKSLDKLPIGLWSKNFLHKLAFRKEITVQIIKKDRYGRYLGEIFYEGESLNLKMVEQGHALIYRNYEFQTIKQKVDYLSSELSAKRKRLGVWQTFGFYDPHAYRRFKRRKHKKKD